MRSKIKQSHPLCTHITDYITHNFIFAHNSLHVPDVHFQSCYGEHVLRVSFTSRIKSSSDFNMYG